jgi:protein-disulfide isomerase
MMATLKVPVTSNDHIQGDEYAPIVLVEYGDYECPDCGRAHLIVKRVQKHFGKRLGFVFRNFPLSEIHPNAASAAEAAEFAGANGRFWEMHDGIFENQNALSLPLLLTLAEAQGLSTTDLDSALTSHEYARRVKSDFTGGARSGVNGTPTFFINSHRHAGTYEFDDLVAGIEARKEQS